MQATDRAAFMKLAEALFAAFDKPQSDARLQAYWLGLQSMNLLQFETVVLHVIGPEGEDELPTPKQLYPISRRLRNAQRAAELAGRKTPPKPGETPPPEPDRFDCYTGRVLFAVLCALTKQHGSGATDESLAEMVHVKHNFAKGYREQCLTDPDASLELRDALTDALKRRFIPREPREPSNNPLAEPARGQGWQHALAAIAASNADNAHNAPPDSPHWRAAL